MDFGCDPSHADYERMHENRLKLLRVAYERSHINENPAYQNFCRENAWWLDDYALFMAVKAYFHEQSWQQWPEDIRMHWGFALDYYREKLYFDVEFQKYLQFKFYEQWSALKAYANSKHIEIIGDMPIYVSPDGADVWAHPEMFQLDSQNRPTQIAGCPPDAFAADGQLWGNPLYRWDYHRQTGYQWWVTRMWYSYKLYDVVRIDHFRGFDEYFAIPAGSATARDGHWEKGPGMELFRTIRDRLGERKVIAEDLGLLTDTVRQLVKDSGFPNMKVLQFAFDPADVGGANDYLPHNYSENCVVYTGTHDNETLTGWFRGLTPAGREQVRDYLDNHDTPDGGICRALVSLAMMSTAKTCIVPIQDWLGLDNSCRMNAPGTVGVNWSWRLLPGQVTDELGENYGAAQLPCITIDGEQMQMKSFSGSKALGVNPNSKNMKAAYALAAWLGSAEMQALHYELRDGGVVPCNTELLASDEFSSNPAALAQNDTIANTSVLQPSIPEMGAYWSNAESMGKGLANGEITAANALEKTDLWNEAINNTGL